MLISGTSYPIRTCDIVVTIICKCKMRQYHSPDGATAAAFYDSLTSRHFSCFDKKNKYNYSNQCNIIQHEAA